MKKFDVGIKEKELYGEPVGETSRNRTVRPSFSLTQKQLPPLKGKKFDEHFTLEIDVRIESIRSTENEKTEKITYEIEVIQIGMKGGKLSDKEFSKLSDSEQTEHMRKSKE